MRTISSLAVAYLVSSTVLASACREASPGRPNEVSGSPVATGLPGDAPAGLLTFSAAGAIWQVNADGSQIALAVRPPDTSTFFTSPTLSPVGDRMAYIASNGTVLVADVGNPADPVTRIDLYTDLSAPPAASNWSMTPRAVHWSPDGAWLLVTRQRCCGSGAADIILVRPDGSAQHLIVEASRLPSFPEATWSEDRSPFGRPASIVVVGGADGLSGVAYDIDGREFGRALPIRASRYGVASHQNPAGEGALITSALGNPEPFGPIELIDITGEARIVGGGCGAVWAPDGTAIAYYNGYGIVVQSIGDSPEDAMMIVPNSDLSLPDPGNVHEDVCASFAMVWHSSATPAFKRQPLPDLGVSIEYPAQWTAEAAAMPYATCNRCTVVGPIEPDHPYGIQLWKGMHQVGCQLTCYLNIRALPQGPTYPIDANGHIAFRQEFERQRPLGLVNADGDNTSYREILTVVPLVSVEGLSPEAVVPAVFIDAFFRYGDMAAEKEAREAMGTLIASLEIEGKP